MQCIRPSLMIRSDFEVKETCFLGQAGKSRVPRSVLACGLKSHFPHRYKGYKGHSFFECPLFLYINKSANYYHQKQSRWNRTKSLILWKRNLFRRLTKASPRCPSQYWRVGSSPISRTSVKDIRFFECPLFYMLYNIEITYSRHR